AIDRRTNPLQRGGVTSCTQRPGFFVFVSNAVDLFSTRIFQVDPHGFVAKRWGERAGWGEPVGFLEEFGISGQHQITVGSDGAARWELVIEVFGQFPST